MSFWLHSSGQLSVFTFLQNGIIWQLFLLRPANCRANPLAAPCTPQQIPFVSAELPSSMLITLYLLHWSKWLHAWIVYYLQSNQSWLMWAVVLLHSNFVQALLLLHCAPLLAHIDSFPSRCGMRSTSLFRTQAKLCWKTVFVTTKLFHQ